ncbi:Hypothetical predicted protein [Mytilus galloprovincialis]|uniref:Uncharacterized protein n=1 Tax=Mytilus galloprovincialis TaxID=29158 RepID=A0A8B6D6I3_MYTGA|nr:Hypothetical predicted protein [Mytilus galloprovincialis]
MPTSSSASSLSMSWRTYSPGSTSTTTSTKSVDLTRKSTSPYKPGRVTVAPADNMGMKFPSWREPKPLRPSRPSTAIETPTQSMTPFMRPRSYVPKEKNLLSRLSKPTTATKLKTLEFNRRINFIDCTKYFSWSNMKLYQDQTRMFYTRNGGLRNSAKSTSSSRTMSSPKKVW